MAANAQQKSAYKKRNGICKRIGSTLAALDRYLATVIGSPAARAAMDHLKIVNARGSL